jgi:hypothetical protein
MTVSMSTPSIPSFDMLKQAVRAILIEEKELLKPIIVSLLNDDETFRRQVASYITPELANRVLLLEEKLEVQDRYLLDDDAVTIPEEIGCLKRNVDNINAQLKGVTIPESLYKSLDALPTCETDVRADLLVKYIESTTDLPKVLDGISEITSYYINSRAFKHFVEDVLPEQYRPKSTKNLRKLKKDVFETAALRHPRKVTIDKSGHGRKELRLVQLLPTVTELQTIGERVC